MAKGTLNDELFVIERNPYFFAVDEEGQQLPYIDKLTHRLFESPEVLSLWITNGEIDFQYRHTQIANLPLYKSSEAAGDYQVVLGVLASHVGMRAPSSRVRSRSLRSSSMTAMCASPCRTPATARRSTSWSTTAC